ncbi:MAG TPA: hypothetical protein VM577_20310 [Anaerovoracaceae bacterium]|nr:hypothetical protein [Anaerovoracaceae bacterium]
MMTQPIYSIGNTNTLSLSNLIQVLQDESEPQFKLPELEELLNSKWHERSIEDRELKQGAHGYAFAIDEYVFMLSRFNKYRSSDIYTVYICTREETDPFLCPIFRYNKEKNRFTNYYIGAHVNSGPTMCNRFNLGDVQDFKGFKKLQKKYNDAVNRKLLLSYILEKDLVSPSEAKPKKLKI